MRKIIVFILACAAAAAVGAAPTIPAGTPQTALFAGGCFWSMQSAFEKVYGVITAVSGYTGGKTKKPTYDNYAENGHVEAVQVTWDPARVSYGELLDAYWHHTDPTDGGGQFVDRGPSTSPSSIHERPAEGPGGGVHGSAGEVGEAPRPDRNGDPQGGRLLPGGGVSPGLSEEEPGQLRLLLRQLRPAPVLCQGVGSRCNGGSGRATGEGASWQKPSEDQLKKMLTPMQFDVTQREGTEPPFHNEYWNNEREGIYVDIVSGEPLFSSTDKFDSGTGWPSFTRPLVPEQCRRFARTGASAWMRTEVKSRYAGSHLGHLFDDGPAPTGLRYCMDSASLRFIPVSDLQKDGYGQYLKLFTK